MLHAFARIESLTITRQKPVDTSEDPQASEISLYEEVPVVRSELLFRNGIEVEHKGCKQTTYIADLEISFRDLNESRNFIDASVAYSSKNDEGQVQKFEYTVTVHVTLAKAELPNFLERMKLGLAVVISFNLEKPLVTSNDWSWVTSAMGDLLIVYQGGTVRAPNWCADSIEAQANLFVEPLALTSHSQLGRIMLDLSKSAAKTNRIIRAEGEDLVMIKDMIVSLKYSLRQIEPNPSDESVFSNFLSDEPDSFKKRIAKLDATRQKELTKQFDTVWNTFDLASVISGGEEGYGASQSGFDPKPDELELVATQMLALRPLRSPTLESIVVNALIYAETIEFARNVLSKEKMFGIRVPSKVRKKEQSELKILGYLLWGFFIEAVKIGLTVLASFVITNENVIAAWVVATGFTLFRWWNNTFTDAQKHSNKEQRLLLEMCAVHQMSNKFNYNARLLRQALYEVCSQGAVFSPMIFTILDMQIQEGDS